MKEEKNANEKSREHLANERTFLAWVRTGIALMGFGFVIVKFALFLRQISALADVENPQLRGYSAVVGVVMVALGTLVATFAFFQYKRVERQINSDTYIPSSLLSIFLTLTVLFSGVLLVIYLIPKL